MKALVTKMQELDQKKSLQDASNKEQEELLKALEEANRLDL
jgi:hypothetical protein